MISLSIIDSDQSLLSTKPFALCPMNSTHILEKFGGHLLFNDHYRPSVKSSALFAMNSAHILKKFAGHLFLGQIF